MRHFLFIVHPSRSRERVTLLLFWAALFASCALIATGASAADTRLTGAPINPSEVGVALYGTRLIDNNNYLKFRFAEPPKSELLGLFVPNSNSLNNLRSWNIESAQTQSPNSAEIAQNLRLLYWQHNFAYRQQERGMGNFTKIPQERIEPDTAKLLRFLPVELPTAALKNIGRGESYWYRKALERLLSSPTPDNAEMQQNLGYASEALAGAKDSHELLDIVAESFEESARAGGALHTDAQFAGNLARSAQKLIRGKQAKSTIEKGINVFTVQVGGDSRKIKAAEMSVLLNVAISIMQKMALDEKCARQLQLVLDGAQPGTLNPDFEREARALIEQSNSKRVAIVAAMEESLLDAITKGAISKTDEITPQRLALWLVKSAPALATRFAISQGYAKGLTVGAAQLSLAVFVADIAFNTDGLYEGIKTADFLARCSEEFAKIQWQHERNVNTNQANARDVEEWARAIYLNGLCVGAFEDQYGDTLEEGRLSRVFSDWMSKATNAAGLTQNASLAEDIETSRDLSRRARSSAREWQSPPAIPAIMALYADVPRRPVPAPTPTLVVSAPVLVIDRSGSISDVAGVMEQVQNKAEDVVRAIQRNVSGAAVINFSGAGNSAVDTGFTSDSATLLRAIRAPSIGNTGTAIYDAVGRAVEVARTRGERTMMILFTDGKNNQGRGLEEAILGCKAAGVPVVIVGFVGSEGRDEKSLQTLAFSTGGFYVPSESADIAELLERFRFYSQSKAASRIRGSAD